MKDEGSGCSCDRPLSFCGGLGNLSIMYYFHIFLYLGYYISLFLSASVFPVVWYPFLVKYLQQLMFMIGDSQRKVHKSLGYGGVSGLMCQKYWGEAHEYENDRHCCSLLNFGWAFLSSDINLSFSIYKLAEKNVWMSVMLCSNYKNCTLIVKEKANVSHCLSFELKLPWSA